MDPADLSSLERILALAPEGRFAESELQQLPDPVRRYFRSAIAPGTPLARTARISMHGSLRIGRWLPFRAREILTPLHGFIWAARAAWLISGSDHYAEGRGELDWKLAGRLRLAHADGPDVSRSAAERAAAEAVWLPTTLLPRFGVQWAATDDSRIDARYRIDHRPVHIHYGLTDDGTIRSVEFERWGDPDESGTWSTHPFGGEFSNYSTFGGVTVPSVGRLGWHYGTERWPEGEFFRFRITDLVPVTDAVSPDGIGSKSAVSSHDSHVT